MLKKQSLLSLIYLQSGKKQVLFITVYCKKIKEYGHARNIEIRLPETETEIQCRCHVDQYGSDAVLQFGDDLAVCQRGIGSAAGVQRAAVPHGLLVSGIYLRRGIYHHEGGYPFLSERGRFTDTLSGIPLFAGKPGTYASEKEGNHAEQFTAAFDPVQPFGPERPEYAPLQQSGDGGSVF